MLKIVVRGAVATLEEKVRGEWGSVLEESLGICWGLSGFSQPISPIAKNSLIETLPSGSQT